MLHTILFVLKIIGISLAVIVGIVFILLTLILFVPIQYRVEGTKNSEADEEWFVFHFSWMVCIFRGQVLWKDNKFAPDVFLFGKRIYPLKKKKAKGILKKKYTFKRICDIIKIILKKSVEVRDFFTNHTHHQAYRVAKKEFLILWRFLKPKKMDVSITYGAEDPYVTGKFLAIMSVLYAWYGDSIDVRPDFTQQIFQGTAFIKGRVCAFRLVVFVFRMAFNDTVMKTFHDIEKLADV